MFIIQIFDKIHLKIIFGCRNSGVEYTVHVSKTKSLMKRWIKEFCEKRFWAEVLDAALSVEKSNVTPQIKHISLLPHAKKLKNNNDDYILQTFPFYLMLKY